MADPVVMKSGKDLDRDDVKQYSVNRGNRHSCSCQTAEAYFTERASSEPTNFPTTIAFFFQSQLTTTIRRQENKKTRFTPSYLSRPFL
jgi:hypothetical protein